MNDFAQFFKRTQVQQIYVVLVCSLLMYAFLYVEISDFRELDYQVEVTLALASGSLIGFVSISLSYIHYYNLHKNVREKISTRRNLTEIPVTLPDKKNKQREHIEHDTSDKSEFIDDSYLGLALFISITALIFMYMLWCSGVVDYISGFLFNTSLSNRERLYTFFILYAFFSIVCVFLSGFTYMLKGMYLFTKKPI